MKKLTVAEVADKFGVSKEAIHNRIRRGSLKSVVEDGIKLVIIDDNLKIQPQRTNTRKTTTIIDDRYYKLLEEQNHKLQEKVEILEKETRSLRDQKEQMLIAEREKIEQIYRDKDEQLKNILNAISSKFMLNTPEVLDTNEVEEEELVEAEIDEQEIPQNCLISLNKHLKDLHYSKKKRQKIKDRFKKIVKEDERIITISNKHYIDLLKYDYSDLLL